MHSQQCGVFGSRDGSRARSVIQQGNFSEERTGTLFAQCPPVLGDLNHTGLDDVELVTLFALPDDDGAGCCVLTGQ